MPGLERCSNCDDVVVADALSVHELWCRRLQTPADPTGAGYRTDTPKAEG